MQDIAADLAAFAARHKMRSDWHEPDEQEVSAVVYGDHLDNAHGNALLMENPHLRAIFPEGDLPQEFVIELRCEDDVLRVNLASLLALAAGKSK